MIQVSKNHYQNAPFDYPTSMKASFSFLNETVEDNHLTASSNGTTTNGIGNGTTSTTIANSSKETASSTQNGKPDMTRGERIGMICSLSVGVPSALYALVELYRHWTSRKDSNRFGHHAITVEPVRNRILAVRSRWSL